LAHMEQMKAAGVGVVVATWWGRDTFTDKAMPVVFAAAEQSGLKVCFHIEPFPGRNANTMRESLAYLMEKYGAHPALYRDPARGNRPWAYVYDSYLTPAKEWATILAADGAQTIRGTNLDTVMIGLWVNATDGIFISRGSFDGFYTYFAVDGFRYGSTPKNWPALAKWAADKDKIFVPSVGPGYDDTRIRPWNGQNQRDRENGAYYDRMFEAAIAAQPPVISITSFNEWHEGTQIEPAMPKKIEGYTYLDYGQRPPGWYLERTRYWLDRWLQR
jgi:glycoprotein endo-alpha-1,2-mannosidase